jgi:hypothetical protein
MQKTELTVKDWGMMMLQKVHAVEAGMSGDPLDCYGVIVGIRGNYIQVKYTEENSGRYFNKKDCKPVLRKFSAVTVKEAEEFNKFKDPKGRFEALMPLLRAGVDVFGWIDLGLAEEDKG